LRYRTVIFDCDSTLSAIEGIDELAGGLRAEVAALTDLAMRGELPLEAVYGRRLELVRPDAQRIEELGRRYIDALVPDARETVRRLQHAGVDVRIISGGLLPPVLALAAALGVPDTHVAAVPIRFTDDGAYAGFDAASPLARTGGKREVIDAWVRAGLPRPVMLVGDGATDLEAKPAVDLFVAYAGVLEREAVSAAADVVFREPSLLPVAALALGGPLPGVAGSAGNA
jgi:phosphoserine phosphatase